MPRHSITPKSTQTRICENCGKDFDFIAYPSRVKRGHGRFCSRQCGAHCRVIPLEIRFRQFVGQRTKQGCILWIGATFSNGYGIIRSDAPSRKSLLAHRVSYELQIGPIPDGMMVCHHCDNRPCVNPKHLFLGTAADNIADKVIKGRSTRGESVHWTKLKESDVRAIRQRYSQGGIYQRTLAEEYGISQTLVSSIITRTIWKHI